MMTIIMADKNIVSILAPGRQVVEDTFKFHAKRSSHGLRIGQEEMGCKVKN